MPEVNDQDSKWQQENKHALDKRLESLGWGLFLIMIGCLWLIPDELLPEGTWLVGTGIIILGLATVRYFKDIQVSGFWLALGVIALGIGLGEILGLDVPVVPVLLIIIGAALLLKPLLKRRQ